MAKDTRKYYRIYAPNTSSYGIVTTNMEVRIEPYFIGHEDMRLDFSRAKEMVINLQQITHKDEAPYWFITGYEFPSDIAYNHFGKFALIAQEIKEFIANRERAVRTAQLGLADQLKLRALGYTEIVYPDGFGYFYPAEFAPTPTKHKWIMLVDPRHIKGKKKPAATHVYKNEEVAYLGFVYADNPIEAHQRIYERLVHFEKREDLYEAYSKYNPIPRAKFEVWPELKQIDA